MHGEFFQPCYTKKRSRPERMEVSEIEIALELDESKEGVKVVFSRESLEI